MKKVYTADDPVAANLLKELLDNAGIDATVEGERLHPLQGAIPIVNPTVWVREEDYEAACRIVAEYERSRGAAAPSESWTCPKCGEQIEGAFDSCYKCDVEKDEAEQFEPEIELPKEKHPLVTVHPGALRACATCRCLMRYCVGGAVAGTIVILALMWATRGTLAVGAVSVLAASVLGAMGFLFARFFIIAFFFTRYSLAQLLGICLLIGACGTGVAVLPDPLKALSVCVLLILTFMVCRFVARQDPEGEAHTPAFLRQTIEKQNSARNEEQADTSDPPAADA